MNTRPAGNIGTRVNLTLPDDVLAAVDRMAKAGGVGRATLIKDLITGMAPSLIEMARATELAKSKQIDAMKVISDHLTAVASQAARSCSISNASFTSRSSLTAVSNSSSASAAPATAEAPDAAWPARISSTMAVTCADAPRTTRRRVESAFFASASGRVDREAQGTCDSAAISSSDSRRPTHISPYRDEA